MSLITVKGDIVREICNRWQEAMFGNPWSVVNCSDRYGGS